MGQATPRYDPLQHLTINEVMQLSRLSRRTIERAIAAHQLHANHVGARVLIPRAAAEQWLTGNGNGDCG